MTPILILLFGVSPATAVGTDCCLLAATKTVGSLVHGYNNGRSRGGSCCGSRQEACRPRRSRSFVLRGCT